MPLRAPNRTPISAAVVLVGAEPSPAPAFVELGAVNAWASTGALRLWRQGETLSPAVLDELLASRPDLVECAHPVAVEVATDKPRGCWVGVTVSTQIGSRHRLDRDALADVLARLASPSR